MDSLLQSLLLLSSVRNCFLKLNFLMISSIGGWTKCALPVGSKSLALCALLLNIQPEMCSPSSSSHQDVERCEVEKYDYHFMDNFVTYFKTQLEL